MVSNSRAVNIWSNEVNKNTTSLKDLKKVFEENRKSVNNLGDYIFDNLNVVGKLTDTIKKAEKLQMQSIAIGTTYSKFVQANTKAISNSVATQQEMTEALLQGFTVGVRRNTDQLISLTDEMIQTGQSTKSLFAAVSNLSTFTGDNIRTQEDLLKTTQEVSRTYGVSTERLSNAINNLQDTLAEQSLFGSQAVEAFADVKLGLVGLTAGKPAAERQIDVLLQMLDPLNVAQQELLGLRGLSEDMYRGIITGNNVGEKLGRAYQETLRRLPEDPRERQAFAEAVGRRELTALMNIGKLLENNYELTDEMKSSAEERMQLLRNRQRYVDRFYQDLAPDIHQFLYTWLPVIATGMMVGRTAFQARGALKGDSRFANIYNTASGMGPRGIRGKLSAMQLAGQMTGKGILGKSGILGGASRLGMLSMGLLGGPAGIALTGISLGLPILIDLFKNNTKDAKRTADGIQEINARARSATSSDRAVSLASVVASEAIRGQINPNTQESILSELRKLVNLQKASMSRNGQGSGL